MSRAAIGTQNACPSHAGVWFVDGQRDVDQNGAVYVATAVQDAQRGNMPLQLLSERLTGARSEYIAARYEFALALQTCDQSQIRAASRHVSETLGRFAEAKITYEAALKTQAHERANERQTVADA